jgi:hypothetical protein
MSVTVYVNFPGIFYSQSTLGDPATIVPLKVPEKESPIRAIALPLAFVFDAPETIVP